jgi:hypothetical protein
LFAEHNIGFTCIWFTTQIGLISPHNQIIYVVFGKQDTNAIELSAIAAGTGGFVINGESEGAPVLP